MTSLLAIAYLPYLIVFLLIPLVMLFVGNKMVVVSDKLKYSRLLWIVFVGSLVGGLLNEVNTYLGLAAIVILILWMTKKQLDASWKEALVMTLSGIIFAAVLSYAIGFATIKFMFPGTEITVTEDINDKLTEGSTETEEAVTEEEVEKKKPKLPKLPVTEENTPEAEEATELTEEELRIKEIIESDNPVETYESGVKTAHDCLAIGNIRAAIFGKDYRLDNVLLGNNDLITEGKTNKCSITYYIKNTEEAKIIRLDLEINESEINYEIDKLPLNEMSEAIILAHLSMPEIVDSIKIIETANANTEYQTLLEENFKLSYLKMEYNKTEKEYTWQAVLEKTPEGGGFMTLKQAIFDIKTGELTKVTNY